MLSIIMPVYREPYLNQTIDSILENSLGDIEIIPIVDGYLPSEPIRDDPRVRPVFLGENRGMRGAMNAGLEQAKGEFVMKLDAHCAVAKGFDLSLTVDCRENWLLVPRRYSLDEKTWTKNENRPIFDYHYLSFPGTNDPSYGYSLQVVAWQRKKKDEIDDIMTFQGSCWVANRKYFMEHVGFLDDSSETYGTFAQDQQEIGLKYWLGGGKVKVTKKTWYAHLSKRGHHYESGEFSRKHKKDQAMFNGNEWGTRHWMNNEESKMIHPFSWWVEKFSPIPTWPENWQKVWEEHK